MANCSAGLYWMMDTFDSLARLVFTTPPQVATDTDDDNMADTQTLALALPPQVATDTDNRPAASVPPETHSMALLPQVATDTDTGIDTDTETDT